MNKVGDLRRRRVQGAWGRGDKGEMGVTVIKICYIQL